MDTNTWPEYKVEMQRSFWRRFGRSLVGNSEKANYFCVVPGQCYGGGWHWICSVTMVWMCLRRAAGDVPAAEWAVQYKHGGRKRGGWMGAVSAEVSGVQTQLGGGVPVTAEPVYVGSCSVQAVCPLCRAHVHGCLSTWPACTQFCWYSQAGVVTAMMPSSPALGGHGMCKRQTQVPIKSSDVIVCLWNQTKANFCIRANLLSCSWWGL